MDNGICAIGCCVKDKCKKDNERKDDSYGHVYKHKHNRKDRSCGYTEKSADVSLYSENGEENRILEKLQDRKVKGYHHQVNIHSHEEIQKRDTYHGKEHDRIKHSRREIEIVENDIVKEDKDNGHIHYAEDKRLLKISPYRVEKVLHQKDRLLSEEVTHYVGRTNHNRSECEYCKSCKTEKNVINS